MRISLTQGAYEARSIIAEAQRCVNLYPESNPDDSPSPTTHYPTPGLDLLSEGTGSPVRLTYRASNGELYVVEGASVYFVDSSFARTLLGTITYGITPVSMADNGLAIVLVDGSANGWAIDMATHTFGAIPADPLGPFYGSPRVDYLDTFFLLSRPNTNQWYISLSSVTYAMLISVYGSIITGSTVGGSGYTDGTYTNVSLTGGSGTGATGTFTITGGIVGTVTIVNPGANYVIGNTLSVAGIGPGAGFSFQVESIGGAFDPLDIATKNGYPDPIVGLIVMHREIWIIGQLTAEIWYNAGAADFPFQAMPGAFVEHGAGATYSLCAQDLSVYWISLDKQGRAIFMRGTQYQALRISTHAIENEWLTYPTTADGICFISQQEGHTFIFVVFPTANKTWVYDQATSLWHQRAWTDNNGVLNRHRANCCANAYNLSVVGDWENGNLYAFSLQSYTDSVDGNGLNSDGSYPISFIKSFPHLVEDGNRICYGSFAADFQAGTDTGSIDGSSGDTGGITAATITGGTSYTNGTHTNIALTGGSGVGALANITIVAGIVTTVTLVEPGQGYQIGDILSAMGLGPGSGFLYTVNNVIAAPSVSLRWSDNRGASYGNKVEQSMGAAGQYLIQPQWSRLGIARDRVFELSWSTPTLTGLNGAWIDVTPAKT